MAIAGEEVELLEEGTHIVGPTRGAFALNMLYRQDAWRVRKGFGQVTQFTTQMPKNKTTDTSRAASRIAQKWGYQKHLGSALISTSFGHDQIVSVFYCDNHTGDGADKTQVMPLYCVNIYDITTDARWEEPIYVHTSTNDVRGQVTATSRNLGQDVESWYAHYDTDLQVDAQKWVSATDDEQFYFQEYAHNGETNVLFFGSKRTGLMYYVPATMPKKARFRTIDSEFYHEWANPYGESSLVQQATVRVPTTEVGESIAYLRPDEVGTPDAVCALGSRLVYAVNRTILFSDINDPTAIGTDNVIVLPSENDVVAMADFNGQLLILTSDETFVYQPSTGATVSAGRLMPVSDTVGCVGPSAITRALDALFFVDKSGVYTYSGDLQIRLSSGRLDAYFTDYASNPLTSFFEQNGYTPLQTEQPHTTLYMQGSDVNCTYAPELRALLITVPEQNLTICLSQSKWSFWSYTSSAYYATATGGGGSSDTSSFPGIVQDSDNPEGRITHPWLVCSQEELFLVGSTDTQSLTDAAQKYTGSWVDVDDDVKSSSAYILRYGRGGGIDRSVRDEDDRYIAGKYVPQNYTPSANGVTWYVDPWIPVSKGYVFPNGYTVASDDNVWLLPLVIVPSGTVMLGSSAFSVTQFKIWMLFDHDHWQPVVQGADQTASSQIDFLLPSERIASWKGYYVSHSPNAMGADEKVQVYDSSGGSPAYNGDEIRVEWYGGGPGHTTGDWYHCPDMNLSPVRRQVVMYIPIRATDASYNVSGAGLTVNGATEGGLVLPWVKNSNTGSGVTSSADNGFIPWEQWTTTDKRALDNVAQPVEWAFKSPEVGDGAVGVKARGLFSKFVSKGSALAANYLVPNWVYGLFNVAVASEQKGWTMQVVDTTQDSSAVDSPAYEESRSEGTIRTRVKDSTAGLVDKTFGTTGIKYGSSDLDNKTQGTYLIDDPNPEIMATSLSVKGRSFTYMIFGFVQERAQSLSFESVKAVLRRAGGGRRRRGR